jgi:putative transposase
VALVKPEYPWYYECSKSAPQEALRALKIAWDRYFHKTAGVPKFKKKGQQDNFTLEGAVKILGTNKIKVPKIGILKTYEQLPQVKPKSVSISRQADRWFISFRLDVEQQKSISETVVGVDLGVKTLATLKEILGLSERVFDCSQCNFSLDRDLNAAINLSRIVS